MAAHLAILIGQYGLLLVFASVLAEQAGAPVPAFPILVLAGAAAAAGRMSSPGIVGAAFAASLLPDLAWFWAGRRFGARILRLLCRLSLSPDSCVHRAELQFGRWRGRVLLVAKFVPGLSMVAPPLVGALGLRLRTFVLLDGLGALAWIGAGVGLGCAFAGQVDAVLVFLGAIGWRALELGLALLALYVLYKWWQRWRVRMSLRMARVSPAALHGAMQAGQAPLVLDARSAVAREFDPRMIRGAVTADPEHMEIVLHGVASDRELVIYCNCPHEATSARAAKAAAALGYRHVHPLQGGLAAWTEAGYPLQSLPRPPAAPTGDPTIPHLTRT